MKDKIKQIRLYLELTQKDFADKIASSQSRVYAIEAGKQQPSAMLLELLVYKFNVNPQWLYEDIGEIFNDQEDMASNKPPSLSSKAMVSAAVLGPIVPQASIAIIAGVGVAHILKNICLAYEVDNQAELAKKHLGIRKSTISNWITNNKIPEKYLYKTVRETGVDTDFLISSSQSINIENSQLIELIDAIAEDCSAWKQKTEDEKMSYLEEYFSKPGKTMP